MSSQPAWGFLLRTSQAAFMVWILFAVFAVGTFEVVSFLQPPTPPNQLAASRAFLRAHPRRDPVPPTVTVAPTEVAKTTEREPASQTDPTESPTSSVSSPLSLSSNEAVELTLPCQGTLKTTFPLTVSQVRLIGQSCSKKVLNKIDIKNETNDFTATVFRISPRDYTTDYIALREGTNRIAILLGYKNAPAEKRELFIFHAGK